MLNVATTRAIPANTSRNALKNPRKSPSSSDCCSSVSAAPVRASDPSGRAGSSRSTSSCWVTPSSATTRTSEMRPGSGSRTCWANSVVKAA